MKSADIRLKFLEYFKNNGHKILPGSPLVPDNDPTLLFTNAGMVQFKEVFLGSVAPPYRRAVTSQRCVRAGGKHNDLENVGYTARHHTFFEMLGNFSFGDYFKHDAIKFAWIFLTGILKIPAEKLWITVYEDDDEAAAIWLNEIQVDKNRFTRCGANSNFWMMGDIGPCGPCTEIFYDHGPEVAGGPPGSPDADGDRYVEIWNLVFMQYSRDKAGMLTPLPKPSVDTGMGLERLSAVMQGVHSNYDIDLFQAIIKFSAKILQVNNLHEPSLKVIADHIRSASFLIVDGVIPGNEGRNYVLRRIIRRAIRHGFRLGASGPFFYKLVKPLVDEMGQVYPELASAQLSIEKILKQEEEQFAKTLDQGLKILEQSTAGVTNKIIPGDTVFRLYDTFGFPVDLTADIAREKGWTIDQKGFDLAMEKQKQQSRAGSHFSSESLLKKGFKASGETAFVGYTELQTSATIVALYNAKGRSVSSLTDEAGMVVLDRSPFYAEGGGQVGDQGTLAAKQAVFTVTDTQHSGAGRVHVGELCGKFSVQETVSATVDAVSRQRTRLHHSATHLLNAALREVLGTHTVQKGSLVEPTRLRFDFSHPAALTHDEIFAVEKSVNDAIRANYEVATDVMTVEKAKSQGAVFLAGEKYAGEVRVLSMGDFSKELCGGTHVSRTGDIGIFKIISESGVASGVRRIEAITGEAALHYIQQQESQISRLAQQLKSKPEQMAEKILQTMQQGRLLEKEIERLNTKLASMQGALWIEKARNIKGVSVLVAQMDSVDNKILRDTVGQLTNKLGASIVILAAVNDGKISIIASVTHDSVQKVKANDLVNFVAEKVGGKGGGRADMAQAGGTIIEALPAALESVYAWVNQQL